MKIVLMLSALTNSTRSKASGIGVFIGFCAGLLYMVVRATYGRLKPIASAACSRFMLCVRRPALRWLSVKQVTTARNQILGLFLEPEEMLRAPAPENRRGIYWIDFASGLAPVFCWETTSFGRDEVQRSRHVAWLKCPNGKLPYFDLQVGDAEVTPVAFNDPRLETVVRLLAHLSNFFPYWPTENYLEKGGDFIA